MGSRKRAKPNPQPDESPAMGSSGSRERDEMSKQAVTPKGSSIASSPDQRTAEKSRTGEDAARTPQSWRGGTWPRLAKSAPSTEVARESITASSPTVGQQGIQGNNLSRHPSSSTGNARIPKDPSIYLSRKLASSNKSLPLPDPSPSGAPQLASNDDRPAPENDPVPDPDPTPSSNWLGWLPRSGSVKSKKSPKQAMTGDASLLSKSTESAAKPADASDGDSRPAESTQRRSPSPKQRTDPQSRVSWFGIWQDAAAGSKAATATPKGVGTESTLESHNQVKADTKASPRIPPKDDSDMAMTDAPEVSSAIPTLPPKTSTWAFWSKDSASAKGSPNSSRVNVGEIAVARSPSESHPEPARIENSGELAKPERTKSAKRDRPKSLEQVEDSLSIASAPSSLQKPAPAAKAPAEEKVTAELSLKQAANRLSPPNLLLPSFKSTFHMLENPSIIQQITRLILQSKRPPTRHVSLVKDAPRIKKALAIGIHGYFPAPFVRTVIGQPTGTSVRFANYAASSIRKWTRDRGYSCDIEKVALEGEGKISDRVDSLWKLLLNWIDHIQKADFILVACHSQGVPVGMILVAKLIEFGCVNANARIGFCGMAGVNLGPFPDYKSRFFGGGSASELFEFSKPQSVVSTRYQDALGVAVKHGVRILYVGSIDDQLVSLESSTFSTISHPYIYRAVFVDGRIHAPDFIAHLVGFALKLRNLGISDHGLIRELSAPLAGSLYSGEGHSRIYDDDIVYDLAVEHALETTAVGDIPLHVQEYEAPTSNNPYILPWSMRGLLEEEYVRTELDKETAELLAQFDEWKPSSKVLKDVKFRLEAVKSKAKL
ncbi:MAG: hypothetical protein M1825_003224 [Sarcosagium campestre]|nr:MAG: hypothetical protein M1825_003224 [Sarcosagium campestre]